MALGFPSLNIYRFFLFLTFIQNLLIRVRSPLTRLFLFLLFTSSTMNSLGSNSFVYLKGIRSNIFQKGWLLISPFWMVWFEWIWHLSLKIIFHISKARAKNRCFYSWNHQWSQHQMNTFWIKIIRPGVQENKCIKTFKKAKNNTLESNSK